MTAETPVVKYALEGHVAVVTLCNPQKLNAMGPRFQVDLKAAFEAVDADPEARVAVLLAEGRAFCAGLDLMTYATAFPQMMTIPSPARDKPRVLQIIRDFQAAINSLEKCRKPVIAAIHGWCIGGGLDLAAACDIRLAAADAVFSLREAKVGILADLGSLQRLPRLIGDGWTRQLAFTAEDIDAAKARHLGLVNAVYPTTEELHAAARQMAETIAANAPLAVQAGKEVLNWGRGRPLDDSLEYVAARNAAILPAEDLMEAVAAFLEKRPPKFQGR